MSLPTKILAAAMRSPHHVHVSYAAHVNGIHVYAHPADTDYQTAERIYLIDATIYLDWDGADERLADVLAMIEEMES